MIRKITKICQIASIFAIAAVISGCASNPKSDNTVAAAANSAAKFTKNYDNAWLRLYDVNDYIKGVYRSNFKNIPQDELLDSAKDYDWPVSTFTLDGTKLYLGWGHAEDRYGKYDYLKLSDENGVIYDGSSNRNETSYFRYENNTGSGVVTQVTINNKDYVIALAGRNTNYDGFRLWVEDSVATDNAEKATSSQTNCTNYDWDDIFEGVYKAGYIRLWGKAAPEYASWFDIQNCSTYKYNYNGVDFVVGFSQDPGKRVLMMDKKNIEPATKNYFKIMSGNKKSREFDLGYCYEGKVKIGDKTVIMAVVWCNGDIRVFIKE